MREKYQDLVTNKRVAMSKGKIYHCPKQDCKGLVLLDKFQLFANKVACDTCRQEVCSSCRGMWHAGTKCSKDDGTELKWDALGNLAKGTANRCPSCRAPFEKAGGCPHMQCMICKHSWCWICGMNWGNPFHKTTAVFCEALGKLNFGNRRGKKFNAFLAFLIEIIFLIFWPVIFLVGIAFLVPYGLYESMRK